MAKAPRNAPGGTNGALGAPGAGPYPESVNRLIAEFARLPGIGKRSAERLAFWTLKADAPTATALAQAIFDVKERVRGCSICSNLTDSDPCAICADPRRERGIVLVVERPRDLMSLEQTGAHRGVYHVLLGRLSPLEGVGPDDLTIAALLARVENPAKNCAGEPVREVILGLNPNMEGDGTALYLADELRARGVRVSRLARGLPTGGSLEHASVATLTDALSGRQEMP